MPTSSGAGVSLNAIGKQDTYLLTDDVDKSIFNYKLKRHSNFTKFHRTTIVNKSPTSPTWPFNENIKVTFNPQNMGDLLSNMYVYLKLPALSTGENYADQIGRHLIKSVTMRIDETEVEKIYDDWMVIYDELYLESSEKVANRFVVNRMLAFDSSSKNSAYAQLESEVIIPLPFFFSRKYSSDEYVTNEPNRPYFPLCAIHKQKIEFEFEFHPQGFFTTAASTLTLDNFKIVTEEFTIDPSERIYLKSRPYTMITDVVRRHPTIETTPGVNVIRTNLVPNNRVKSMHWFLRNIIFENPAIQKVPQPSDTYEIYVTEANGNFTLKNLSFFRVLTQGGVSAFSRVNFTNVELNGEGDTETTSSGVFTTEYNIIPWTETSLNSLIVNETPIIKVTVPANTFIEKFTFDFYTEPSSRVDGTRRLTNIPAIYIFKNGSLLSANEKISDFVSLQQETFIQSYSIQLDTTVFRVPDAIENDYYYIQNRFNFSKTPDFDQTFTFFNPVMTSAKFYIQGVDLPNISSTTTSYYKYLVPYQKRLSRPIRNIYTYSFSINPVNVNPSGSLDFSEIQSEKTNIEIKLDEQLTSTYTLYIYYTGYQTFQFNRGFMSLVY